MSSLLKNLLVALFLAIILFVGYVVFLRDGIRSGSRDGFSEQVEIETQALLATINELKRIKIDGEIFTNPVFVSLKDFRVDLGTEPTGRGNPFAPVE
jgi:hypothetical protein